MKIPILAAVIALTNSLDNIIPAWNRNDIPVFKS